MDIRYEIVTPDDRLPIRFFHNEPGQVGKVYQHWHEYLEIIYLLKGEINVTVNTTSYEVLAGDVLAINPNEVHATNCQDPSTAGYILQIPCSFLKSLYPPCEQLCFDTWDRQNPHIEDLKAALHLLNAHYSQNHPAEYIKILSVLYDFIYLLIGHFSLDKEKSSVLHDHYIVRLSQITGIIDQKYCEPLTLAAVANEIGFSSEYLSRFFKKCMGITFSHYLDLVRLEHACNMLHDSSASVTYISDSCGFSSYHIFIKKFKKYYHATPHQYRLHLKSKK